MSNIQLYSNEDFSVRTTQDEDGTPVRQLKWKTSIIPVVEQLMEAS